MSETPLSQAEDNEYVMEEGHGSVWVTVDNISVYIARTDEGVVVDLYPLGNETLYPALGSTWVTFDEAQEEINEDNAKQIGA